MQHPSALEMFEQIMEASRGKQIVMFLDYDGTLSPIVDDPDKAFMSSKVRLKITFILFDLIMFEINHISIAVSQMRRTVKKLAKCFPTAIVTGRCIDKVFLIFLAFSPYFITYHL